MTDISAFPSISPIAEQQLTLSDLHTPALTDQLQFIRSRVASLQRYLDHNLYVPPFTVTEQPTMHTSHFGTANNHKKIGTQRSGEEKENQPSEQPTPAFHKVASIEAQIVAIENNRRILQSQISTYQSQNVAMKHQVNRLKNRVDKLHIVHGKSSRVSRHLATECLDQSSFIRSQQKSLIKQLKQEKLIYST